MPPGAGSTSREAAPSYAGEDRALWTLLARGCVGEGAAVHPSETGGDRPRICQADSAGISILESDDRKPIFRWHATAGDFPAYLGGTTPRDFSPCGVVLDRNAPQLMTNPVRYYPYIAELSPHVAELLLIPFYERHRHRDPMDRGQRRGKAVRRRTYPCDDEPFNLRVRAVQMHTNLDAIDAGSQSLREAQIRLDSALAAGKSASGHGRSSMTVSKPMPKWPVPSPFRMREPPRKNWKVTPGSSIPTTGNMSPTASSSPWNPARISGGISRYPQRRPDSLGRSPWQG